MLGQLQPGVVLVTYRTPVGILVAMYQSVTNWPSLKAARPKAADFGGGASARRRSKRMAHRVAGIIAERSVVPQHTGPKIGARPLTGQHDVHLFANTSEVRGYSQALKQAREPKEMPAAPRLPAPARATTPRGTPIYTNTPRHYEKHSLGQQTENGHHEVWPMGCSVLAARQREEAPRERRDVPTYLKPPGSGSKRDFNYGPHKPMSTKVGSFYKHLPQGGQPR